ncbi:hypothetical protein [Pararhodonellum marinum]|uniref:hypothetical protein n=1 Tax=Pararhodonellum marinum TaxID=2755358 RepID=UPI00188FFB58|nr:hypothetical protein [Pararhodonellum marinum]
MIKLFRNLSAGQAGNKVSIYFKSSIGEKVRVVICINSPFRDSIWVEPKINDDLTVPLGTGYNMRNLKAFQIIWRT